MKRLFSIFLVVVLVLGCASVNSGGSGAKKGAFWGAIAGAATAIIQGKDPDEVLGYAAVGAAAGAIVGYTVGKIKAKKLASREEVAQRRQYVPSAGNQLYYQDLDVAPVRIGPGQSLNISIAYELLTPSAPGVNLTITRQLYSGGELIKEFPSEDYYSETGGYELEFPLTIPEEAATGTYSLSSSVAIEGASPTSKSETFYVVS